MKRFCDLHTHSYFSDGTDSPTRILENAVELGLSAVALTDHNTVAGLPEFLEAAKDKSILAVPGVEISTGYLGKELHIVGLFLRSAYFDEVTAFLGVINRRKEESNRQLIQTLNTAGYSLSYDEISGTHRGNINRAVIAAALMEKGYVSDIKEAFRGLLSTKNGYYQPPERIPTREAVVFLNSIGAVTVLAHPFLSLKEEELIGFIRQARDWGLTAMETRYSTYSPEIRETAIKIAGAYGLMESGGSDYHGGNKPDIHLGTGKTGLDVPAEFATKLRGMCDFS